MGWEAMHEEELELELSLRFELVGES